MEGLSEIRWERGKVGVRGAGEVGMREGGGE